MSRDEQRQEEDTQHKPRCMANRFSIFATLFLLLSAQRGGSVRVEQSAFMREKGMQLKRKGMHVEGPNTTMFLSCPDHGVVNQR